MIANAHCVCERYHSSRRKLSSGGAQFRLCLVVLVVLNWMGDELRQCTETQFSRVSADRRWRSTWRLLALGVGLALSSAAVADPVAAPDAAATPQRAAAPALASLAALVVDLDDGTTVTEKHAQVVLPIASLTKMMTAVVVARSEADRRAWITIKDWHTPPVNNAFSKIRIDSRARRADLMKIALMSSENRAAYNLAANHEGGFDAFVALMNTTAAELGMTTARFVDPMGLSPDNQASAADLAKLAAYAYQHTDLGPLSTTRVHTVNFQGPRYRLGYGATNPLTGRSSWTVRLSKTGFLDEAGRCLLMVADANGSPHAMIFLNSFGKRTPIGDAGRVKRWLETGVAGTINKAAREYEQRLVIAKGLVPPEPEA